MAYVMDEEERQASQQGSAPGATPATAAPSSHVGSAGGAPGTGFQNLSAYFGANQDAAKSQADSLAGKLDTAGYEAGRGYDVGAAESARADIQTAQSQPGIASLYRDDAPPTYTAGQAGLDAYLSGQGGGDAFSALTKHFGALDKVGTPITPTPTPMPGAPPDSNGKPLDPRGPSPGEDPYDPTRPDRERRGPKEIY